MITNERASFIAHQWIDALNKRDVERVLSQYDASIRHTSPLTALFPTNKDGTIRGKRRLKLYFQAELRSFRNMSFAIKDIMVGVDSLSIVYQTNTKKTAVEIMFINKKGKVYKSYGYYHN